VLEKVVFVCGWNLAIPPRQKSKDLESKNKYLVYTTGHLRVDPRTLGRCNWLPQASSPPPCRLDLACEQLRYSKPEGLATLLRYNR
jgi:hypothetical protein